MEVASTNISVPRTIIWNGKEVLTGIYKKPTDEPIFLGLEDVKNDSVIDRKYHGGADKACYLFSKDHYPYWQEIYPELEWEHGMFGENLTVSNCKETSINIGDTYNVGEATVQVSQPRQPCFKLGVKFGNQKVLKEFINQPYPGIYFRVIKPGYVRVCDQFTLLSTPESSMSVSDVFKLLYHQQKDDQLVHKALENEFLAQSCKSYLKQKFLRED